VPRSGWQPPHRCGAFVAGSTVRGNPRPVRRPGRRTVCRRPCSRARGAPGQWRRGPCGTVSLRSARRRNRGSFPATGCVLPALLRSAARPGCASALCFAEKRLVRQGLSPVSCRRCSRSYPRTAARSGIFVLRPIGCGPYSGRPATMWCADRRARSGKPRADPIRLGRSRFAARPAGRNRDKNRFSQDRLWDGSAIRAPRRGDRPAFYKARGSSYPATTGACRPARRTGRTPICGTEKRERGGSRQSSSAAVRLHRCVR